MNPPIQKLLFFVTEDFDPSLPGVIEDFVRRLASSRSWVAQPPVFVNEVLGGVPTLGGYVSIFSALPPHKLAPEIDRQNLEEVKDLVCLLEVLSKERGLVFELELDADPIGVIEDGHMDRCIRMGLLEEWERVLSAREASKATGSLDCP